MAANLFEQLAQSDVPPLPAEFERQVHRRVNLALLAAQLIDLALRGLPYAMLHFFQAVVGLVQFTLTGNVSRGHDTTGRNLQDHQAPETKEGEKHDSGTD